MTLRKSYEERLDKTISPLLKKLFEIIVTKKTNLCVAADFDTTDQLLEFIEAVGPHVCIVKLHTDHFHPTSLTDEFFKTLMQKKKQFNFLIFEDRKLDDLDVSDARTFKPTYVQYANIVTISKTEDEIFNALDKVIKEANLPDDEPRGFLAVCEYSYSKMHPGEVKRRFKGAIKNIPLCCGIIAQTLLVTDQDNMIKASPGVHLSRSGQDQQNWKHPSKVIGAGADIIIVGRGITSSKESWVDNAILYKEVCYQSYLDDLVDNKRSSSLLQIPRMILSKIA